MTDACRLCGSGRLELLYTQGAGGRYRFRRCLDCRLVSYDLSGGLDQDKYRTPDDPLDPRTRGNRAQTATFGFISRRFRVPGRMIDVGCGNGRLLMLARDAGWSVTGLELSRELASEVGSRLGIEVLSGGIARREDLPGGFDLVVMRHVLEHIPEPRAVLERIRGMLAPSGRLLLELPNIDGLEAVLKRLSGRAGLYRKRYPEGYVPGHCNEYCRASLGRLAELTGFVVEHWRTYSGDPFRNAVFGLLPAGGKARALLHPRPRAPGPG